MQHKKFSTTNINVGPNERLASMIGGAGLILAALNRKAAAKYLFALSGGYLIYRGLSGNCVAYEALGIDRSDASQDGIYVTRAVTINRPRPEVYRFWRDFENLPKFMQHLEAVHMIGDTDGKLSHWVVKAPFDKTVEWDAEIFEDRPDEWIAWRSLPGSDVSNSGIVEFRDAPGNRGTEVYITLQYDPPLGSAGAAVAKLMGESPDQQVREDLRRFKEVLEAEEVITVIGQTSGRIQETEQQREEIQRRRRGDLVQKASEESFPASDPPAWTTGPE